MAKGSEQRADDQAEQGYQGGQRTLAGKDSGATQVGPAVSTPGSSKADLLRVLTLFPT